MEYYPQVLRSSTTYFTSTQVPLQSTEYSVGGATSLVCTPYFVLRLLIEHLWMDERSIYLDVRSTVWLLSNSGNLVVVL